ncbi:hypothetical protein [Clostridium kluyveri]|nr:hypothetical protein [Clostridium kluyveri]BAH08109.1 hypothetical protein CKR_3058 [Clostridium kluyveri NBRC 12016]
MEEYKMILAIEIFGILTMCTIIFVLIWGLIIIKQTLSQIKYKNYLLEKITQYMHMLIKKDINIIEQEEEIRDLKESSDS